MIDSRIDLLVSHCLTFEGPEGAANKWAESCTGGVGEWQPKMVILKTEKQTHAAWRQEVVEEGAKQVVVETEWGGVRNVDDLYSTNA